MDITGIFAISGKPGLFKSIAQSKHGVIVESLIDKKRFNAYTSYKVSALEDITVFSVDEDITLSSVLTKIAEKEDFKVLDFLDKSSAEELRKYFASVITNYDAERVYDSDIKKILKWYNLLHLNNRIVKAVEEKAESKAKPAKENKEAEAAPVKEKAAPKAKAPAKAKAAKEEKEEEVAEPKKKKAPAKTAKKKAE
ncbi:MAG: DUF5606 domain-containing protein [Bacteroidetes bacterium]|nr:DUF5606 domain-containing protein [Bacteroidota bacterium]